MRIKCVKWKGLFDSVRLFCYDRGARGVMVIVVGNGHGDTSSREGRRKVARTRRSHIFKPVLKTT